MRLVAAAATCPLPSAQLYEIGVFVVTEIVMPNLGFDSQSGRLIEWMKRPGDEVKRGDVIAIIESDKANVELESVVEGVLIDIVVPADTEVDVGAVIARVGTSGDTYALPLSPLLSPSTATQANPDVTPIARRMAEDHGIDLSHMVGSGRGGRVMREDVQTAIKLSSTAPDIRQGGTDDRRILALPRVRKASREAGIDLVNVPATGAQGQVTPDDLSRYLAAQVVPTPAASASSPLEPAAPPEGTRQVTLNRARRTIGERLGKSMREAPHFYVMGEFDVEAAMASLPERVRINDLLQYLTVRTLVRVPELNATYDGERLLRYESVHLGIAVARDDGLLTPVLRNAERYSLVGIAEEARALIERSREGRLKADEIQGASFTISNLGMVNQVERFTAVINPPQVGILAVGAIKQRPVVVDGGLHIRRTAFLTVSGDHRVVDGLHLARFLATFEEELQRFVR
jgi:pyruvate dehydrogenase E2 component (dihydrolipoamide acetyltransferase)